MAAYHSPAFRGKIHTVKPIDSELDYPNDYAKEQTRLILEDISKQPKRSLEEANAQYRMLKRQRYQQEHSATSQADQS